MTQFYMGHLVGTICMTVFNIEHFKGGSIHSSTILSLTLNIIEEGYCGLGQMDKTGKVYKHKHDDKMPPVSHWISHLFCL